MRTAPAARLGWQTVAAALMAAAWLAGCGYTQAEHRWDRRYMEGLRLLDHGQHDRAEETFEGLMADTSDAGDRRELSYRLAMVAEARGQHDEALARYKALWAEGERDEITSKAIFRAARLLDGPLGDPEGARRMWEELVVQMPDSVASRKALEALLSRAVDEGGAAAGLALLERIWAQVPTSALGDNLLYRRAGLLVEEGDDATAQGIYEQLLTQYPESGLRDDARWELAMLHRRAGRIDETLLLLRFLAEDRESSWLVGNYDSDHTDDARFLMGVLMLEQGRHADAAEQFEVFIEEFEASILLDDARWNIAQVWLRAGDGAEAIEACQGLVEADPESRWVDDCARVEAALGAGQAPAGLAGRVVEP